jgi:hypothetical protein
MTRSLNAVLALAALGFASTSFAQCPASAVPPWSSQSALGGTIAIAAGGFDGTACRMNSTLTTNIGGASGFVRDNTPAGESRYRAQFIVNVDALTGLNSIQSVKLFGAATETPALGVAEVVRLNVFGNIGGTAKTLGIVTACAAQPSGLCSATTALATGENKIEIDWQKGASGSLRVWVNNAVEGTPTTTVNVDNSAWGGVDFAVLGLGTASPGFRSAQLNRAVGFDEFDSRRQTFIGN